MMRVERWIAAASDEILSRLPDIRNGLESFAPGGRFGTVSRDAIWSSNVASQEVAKILQQRFDEEMHRQMELLLPILMEYAE